VNLPRWARRAFLLKTGKKLSKKLPKFQSHFREPVRCLFEGCAPECSKPSKSSRTSPCIANQQQIPGFGVKLHRADFEFGYGRAFKEIPGAYERLLLDFLEGDQRLFIRSDEIEASWKFVDSITEAKEFKKSTDLQL